MAFPAVQGTNESSVNTAGTTHVVNLPSGIQAGELLLILIDKGSTAATFNALAGWTELLDENLANGITILYRWATGSEGASISLTSSASTRSAHISYRISGAHPSTAPTLGTVGTGTSVSPDPGNCNPGVAKDYLWIALFGGAGEELDDDTWCNTAPANFTNLLQKACGTAGTNLGGKIASARRTLNASSLDAGTFNEDVSTAWRAYTIAVHPNPMVEADGSASGSGNVSGTSGAIAGSPGSASGLGVAAGLAALVLSGAMAAAGLASASGSGGGVASCAGAASGVGVASAQASRVLSAIAASAGLGTATGQGEAVSSGSTGSAAGVAAVAGQGAAFYGAAGSASGSAAGAGAGGALAQATGASAAQAACTGVAASPAATMGTAAGQADVQGVAGSRAAAAGQANGQATVQGTGEDASGAGSDGSASGVASVVGVGAAVVGAIGNAAGEAVALGDGGTAGSFILLPRVPHAVIAEALTRIATTDSARSAASTEQEESALVAASLSRALVSETARDVETTEQPVSVVAAASLSRAVVCGTTRGTSEE